MITTALTFLKRIPTGIWVAIGVILLFGSAVYLFNERVEDQIIQAEEKGETQERNKQLEETIKKVEKADEARKDILERSPDGDLTRYNQCLRSARTPENCERFLPYVQAD